MYPMIFFFLGGGGLPNYVTKAVRTGGVAAGENTWGSPGLRCTIGGETYGAFSTRNTLSLQSVLMLSHCAFHLSHWNRFRALEWEGLETLLATNIFVVEDVRKTVRTSNMATW